MTRKKKRKDIEGERASEREGEREQYREIQMEPEQIDRNHHIFSVFCFLFVLFFLPRVATVRYQHFETKNVH